jgi:hypothetical protein
MLSNAYFLEKFRFDTAENGPAKKYKQAFQAIPQVSAAGFAPAPSVWSPPGGLGGWASPTGVDFRPSTTGGVAEPPATPEGRGARSGSGSGSPLGASNWGSEEVTDSDNEDSPQRVSSTRPRLSSTPSSTLSSRAKERAQAQASVGISLERLVNRFA